MEKWINCDFPNEYIFKIQESGPDSPNTHQRRFCGPPMTFHSAPYSRLIFDEPNLGGGFNWDRGPNLFLNNADMVFFRERF